MVVVLHERVQPQCEFQDRARTLPLGHRPGPGYNQKRLLSVARSIPTPIAPHAR